MVGGGGRLKGQERCLAASSEGVTLLQVIICGMMTASVSVAACCVGGHGFALCGYTVVHLGKEGKDLF